MKKKKKKEDENSATEHLLSCAQPNMYLIQYTFTYKSANEPVNLLMYACVLCMYVL